MNIEKQNTNDLIEKIASLLTQAAGSILNASKLLAQCVDKDSEFIDKFTSKYPKYTREFLCRLELVGRGSVHPLLVFDHTSAGKALQKLPLQLQERYVTSPIPTVIKSGDDVEILNIEFRNMTNEQVKQVFDGNRIRSESEQRAWIESRNTKRIIPTFKAPYSVKRDELIISEPCCLTRKELAGILSQMV